MSGSPNEQGTPVSYAEIVRVVELLPQLVREKRRRDGLSLRAAGRLTGLAASTLMRFEDTGCINHEHAIRLLRWVGECASVTEETL